MYYLRHEKLPRTVLEEINNPFHDRFARQLEKAARYFILEGLLQIILGAEKKWKEFKALHEDVLVTHTQVSQARPDLYNLMLIQKTKKTNAGGEELLSLGPCRHCSNPCHRSLCSLKTRSHQETNRGFHFNHKRVNILKRRLYAFDTVVKKQGQQLKETKQFLSLRSHHSVRLSLCNEPSDPESEMSQASDSVVVVRRKRLLRSLKSLPLDPIAIASTHRMKRIKL